MKEKSVFIKIGEEEILIQKLEYNTHGAVAKEFEHDEEGQLFGTTIYYYRPDQQLERTECITLFDVIIETKYEYDATDQLISKTNFQNGEKWEETLYKYDHLSRLIEVREFDAEGNLWKLEEMNPDKRVKKIFEYDDAGNIINEITIQFSATGKVLTKTEIINSEFLQRDYQEINTYDDNDNLTKVEMFEDGALAVEESYFYNEAGIETRSLGFGVDGKTEIIREVNENNNVVLEKIYENDVLENTFTKKYNEHGDLIFEKNWSDRPGNLGLIDEHVYKYIY